MLIARQQNLGADAFQFVITGFKQLGSMFPATLSSQVAEKQLRNCRRACRNLHAIAKDLVICSMFPIFTDSYKRLITFSE